MNRFTVRALYFILQISCDFDQYFISIATYVTLFSTQTPECEEAFSTYLGTPLHAASNCLPPPLNFKLSVTCRTNIIFIETNMVTKYL